MNKPKKILFISDNFFPENNAPANRTYEHAKQWVKDGHNVSVITSVPNFPLGKIHEGYKNKWYQKEVIEGISIYRVKTFIAKNEGFLKRIIDYLSFMITSFFCGAALKKSDVVIGTSPQFFTVISAWLVAKLKGSFFIFELRDLWPHSIISLGVMKRNLLIVILEKIELFLYRQADLIISVTKSFKMNLIERGIEIEKIKIIRNGVLNSNFKNNETTTDIKINGLNDDDFVIGYIGTHGIAHNLENILLAAKTLETESNIKFLFVGEGAEKNKILDLAKTLDLKNCIFLPNQSRSVVPDILKRCSIGLVSLKYIELFKTVIPSKIFEYMAMGLPILFCGPAGEASDIIIENDCGFLVKNDSPQELRNEIIKIKNIDLIEKQSNSKKASKKFERSELAKEMLSEIKGLFN
tara:strand:+ start:17530 stop:18756 length:1227 start_codon:yes stop_codon:yes gene_type:complete